MNSIEKLERITEDLPPIGDLVGKNYNPRLSYKEYEVQNGTAIGFGLYKNHNIAVKKMFVSNGTKFHTHKHKEHEWGIVYSGRLNVFYKNSEEEYGVGNMVYFPPNEPHRIEAVEDSWILFVTVPASMEYPHGE